MTLSDTLKVIFKCTTNLGLHICKMLNLINWLHQKSFSILLFLTKIMSNLLQKKFLTVMKGILKITKYVSIEVD